MKKSRFGRKLAAVLMEVGIILAGVSLMGAGNKAQAAELPVITGLQVMAATEGTGVVANCSYQNYNDQSGCEMRLYLYKMESGTAVIETQKRLSYAEQGNESTDVKQVSEGVYWASVTLDFGTGLRQINSQTYYKITKSDGNYEVTEEIENEPPAQEEDDWKLTLAKETGKANSDCSHVCEYIIEKQATPTRDAIQAYQCVKCGAVLAYTEVPNSAYAAFQAETAEKIRKAQPGEVAIYTDRWVSFNREVFEAIAGRLDVTVIINYQYFGEEYSLTIPAGTDVDVLMDENGYGGFRYMESVLPTLKM